MGSTYIMCDLMQRNQRVSFFSRLAFKLSNGSGIRCMVGLSSTTVVEKLQNFEAVAKLNWDLESIQIAGALLQRCSHEKT